MHIFGLVGRSGSGKTTLMEHLLPIVRARGLTVSTVKHAHHGFDIDKPGKDSWRHREAGAEEVLLISGGRWALLHEVHDDREPSLAELLPRLAPVDLVLVEGFHSHGLPSIEVHRPSAGHPLMWHPGSHIVAVASDEPIDVLGVPRLDLNRPDCVAAFILARIKPVCAGMPRSMPIATAASASVRDRTVDYAVGAPLSGAV
ncbi:MAG: molybdopterin-guanine dinucleotide biosynthesis protein B [Ancalomicrobiaceae bacterium]|nr:molybdopterin-guanine dinucleotide biosynthesis protein B [Ancalomicrobiaceae bacterium]